MGLANKDIPVVQLSESTLKTLGARMPVPTYDRDRLKRTWVHIGVGGFHRAHQAVYLHELAERRVTGDWALCGVGLMPGDKRMEQALLPQQCLYTVVERGAQAESAQIIGSITRYIYAPENREQVLQTLADPATRIVSLTVTEGGYNFNQVTGDFEAANADVQADLQHPSTPTTVFGYVCEALDRRRKAGTAPFTLLSCDNVQSNGAIAKKMMISFAQLRDGALAAWIDANVAFPNSMVDRITPQTTDADREMVARVFGIKDNWPVVTEPFRQWVIEDTFCNGRPPLQEVGAQFVTNVHPYEMMKIRLLNASHQALAYLGYLCGYRYVHDVMNDPLFQQYLARLMDEEITSLLAPVPGVDLAAYKRSLIERFANPKIRDTVTRLAFDASARMPKFLLPSLSEALAANRPTTLLTLAVAGWFRYLTGTDEQGAPIVVEDQMLDQLQPLAQQGKDDPRPLLQVKSLFGDLGQNQAFVSRLGEMLRRLHAEGAKSTMSRYVSLP
jgi:mannitol 2-dehydrogenase